MKTTQEPLYVGSAEIDFTPAPGLSLLGQMHDRKAQRMRDPLMASALAIRQGRNTVVLVSVDICLFSPEFVTETQQAFARRFHLPASRLLLHATHTHVAPSVVSILATKADPAFVEALRNALVEVAGHAVAHLQPARVFSGRGQLDQMGWNRRAMFKDGSSRMYGNSDNEGFAGMEGPRDPTLSVLFARNGRDEITTVVVNASTHPNTLEGDWFYSADIPGEIRRVLKRLLGEKTVVLYLTGASGNTAPSLLDPHVPDQPWRGEAGLARSGLYLGGEAAKVIASAIRPMLSPCLRLEQAVLRIPIRPWPKRSAPNSPDGISKQWKDAHAYYVKARKEWPARLRKMSPLPVHVNVLRVGNTAICTNPAEMFVEFGLDIRAVSPAEVTMISQLTDGYVGYVPTPKAFSRGGYETWNAPTSQLDPSAGPKIVEATAKLLAKAFGE